MLLQVAVELGVQTTLGNQLLMIAILGNLPAVEHQHAVRLFHRRQAMGNDQRGAAMEKFRHRLVQVVLGGGIQGRKW